MFATQPDLLDGLQSTGTQEPPPEDFVQRIRDELNATLVRAQEAATLPWRDLTQAYLAEMRFHSVAGWLPPEEAGRLRTAFAHEMERLNGVSPTSHQQPS
jgi:hypothetical protein